ncbi:MAG: hypothetical protein KGN31_05745 [Betaproteobacteria bacterium]|nr:hypothetical protein [Betaproteobacteria bacterium]
MIVNIDDVPSWLKDDQGHSWLRLINDWGYYHPSELIVGGFIGTLFFVGAVVIWRIAKINATVKPNHWNDDVLFEKSLGLSAEELAEVGLPLATYSSLVVEENTLFVRTTPVENPLINSAESKSKVLPQSMADFSLDECLLAAQFCAWRGDSQGTREAIKRVMIEGNAEQQKLALHLLESSNQIHS